MEKKQSHPELEKVQEYREAVYSHFAYRADAQMDLLDALSSNQEAQSVVELSLNPLFRRGYSSLSEAINAAFEASDGGPGQRQAQNRAVLKLTARYAPAPEKRKFWLFGVDGSGIGRPFARTLADRQYVYAPYAVAGNKPVMIGHAYHATALLLERERKVEPCWLYPLLLERIGSESNEQQVAAGTTRFLQEEASLPWHGQLCVEVADSKYSRLDFIGETVSLPHLVTVTRVRNNQVFYWPAQPIVIPAFQPPKKGAKKRYGNPFQLCAPQTWGEPYASLRLPYTNRKGRAYTAEIRHWQDLLETGTRTLPMHKHPFDLLCVRLLDEHEQPIFKHPLWLKVHGQRRHELSAQELYLAYLQRADLEHFWRFGKQRLLLASFQTPDVEHEESWLQLVQLAYTQLFLIHPLLSTLPRPWERHLPAANYTVASPTQALRQAATILRQIGTPALPPKPRGNSSGRPLGFKPAPRSRPPIVKKHKKAPKRLASP
jgi:hypothetical protein